MARKATPRAGKKPASGTSRAARSKGTFRPEFESGGSGCLSMEVATHLVYTCTGVTAVPPETKLGDLFPDDGQRRGFCGCVYTKARKAGCDVGPDDIPCSKSNTIADVIASITC